MVYVALFLLGFGAFALSTIAGGGGALTIIAVASWWMPLSKLTPIVHLGNFIGRPTRVWIFRKSIRWDIVWMYLPAAWLGAFVGAYLFTQMKLTGLQIVMALFLLSTVWQFRWGKRLRSFPMSRKAFAPLGFVVSFISSITGATGAVLNPFYLNYGVRKEELVATKAFNSMLVAVVQLSTYSFFGKLEGEMWMYGLVLGTGAAGGNYLGKHWLSKMSDKRFLQWVIAMMVVSGLVLLFRALR
jgi:hypothetical protein